MVEHSRGFKRAEFMQPIISQPSCQTVPCDVMGPFPRSLRGNHYYLVITDNFAKWVDLYPLRKLTFQNTCGCR